MQAITLNSQVIKIQDRENQAWFSGADVAAAIGYKSRTQAIVKNVSSKYICEISLGGKGRKPLFISKAGLYELVMKSDLLSVKVLQHWVYEQVLHSRPVTRQCLNQTPPAMEVIMEFLLALNVKEILGTLKRPLKTNDVAMVDYGGNYKHEAIVLDFLQDVLIGVKFLDSGKNGFVLANQLSKID